jgi:two-component system, sensor histidine kinase
MNGAAERELEQRVLVLAPNEKDAALSQRILNEARLPCVLCPDLASLCAELEQGAGAAVLTEQALNSVTFPHLLAVLERQPPWSELPFVVLTAGGADSAVGTHALDVLGNVILLEQPVRVTTLISSLRMALRSRERQYQIREHLRVREENEAALRQADRRKDEFLAMLAHELRNPLAPIRNAAQILRLSHLAAQKLEWAAEVIERQVRYMARLIDDLLDVSRITRSTIQLQRERMDLLTVVAPAVEISRPLLEARRHELTLSLATQSLWVEGDGTRLAQVLANLLVNAAKFTPNEGRIELHAQQEGEEAVLRVWDNGRGMAPEEISGIFDLFMQVDQSLDRAQGGLGIGLTLVRRLVELHGGTVEARSGGEGQGSEFVVRLPLLPVPQDACPQSFNGRLPLPLNPRRVLVVDDSQDAAESLGELLSLMGHDVKTAYDGPQALAAARTFRPEVVFLDLGLPGMSGYDVARELGCNPETSEAVLIALTGYGHEEAQGQGKLAGFAHHLVKPVDLAQMEALLAGS